MKYLSLVFDDGPSFPTCEIADKVKSYGWSAGFAIIGRKINQETIDMIKYILDSGFQVVTHTQNHVHIEKLATTRDMEEELITPIETVRQMTGYEITMARLPFLSGSEKVLSLTKKLKIPLLGQGIDGGRDWDINTKPEAIASAVLGSVKDGAIGCLHVTEATCRALNTILTGLKEMGYCLVTPQGLFEKTGITPPLGVQIHNVYDFQR